MCLLSIGMRFAVDTVSPAPFAVVSGVRMEMRSRSFRLSARRVLRLLNYCSRRLVAMCLWVQQGKVRTVMMRYLFDGRARAR